MNPRKLFVRTAAEADIARAANWYEQRTPSLGRDFAAAVRRSLSDIAADPERFSIVSIKMQVRRALVSRFPYKVFFTIESASIVVHAVLHGRRRERAWTQRIERRAPIPPDA